MREGDGVRHSISFTHSKANSTYKNVGVIMEQNGHCQAIQNYLQIMDIEHTQ